MKTMMVIALTTIIVGFSSAQAFKTILGATKVAGPPKDACIPIQNNFLTVKTGVTVDKSNCNQTFDAKDLLEKPLVKCSGAEPDVGFTFFLIGNNSKVYWAVGNIPGSALQGDGNIEGYDEISPYRKLTETDFRDDDPLAYRYQALIYYQINGKITIDRREHLDVWAYAKEKRLGGPFAGIQAWISKGSLPS